mgnify:CR=1 FL=1
MEIKEIISYFLNPSTNVLDVSFRTIDDNEEVLRTDNIDYTYVEDYGFDLVSESFDFFGEEASHNYQNLSDEILANRKFLKEIMLQNNFRIFESEWWHYNLNGSNKDEVSNKEWRCEN